MADPSRIIAWAPIGTLVLGLVSSISGNIYQYFYTAGLEQSKINIEQQKIALEAEKIKVASKREEFERRRNESNKRIAVLVDPGEEGYKARHYLDIFWAEPVSLGVYNMAKLENDWETLGEWLAKRMSRNDELRINFVTLTTVFSDAARCGTSGICDENSICLLMGRQMQLFREVYFVPLSRMNNDGLYTITEFTGEVCQLDLN